MTDAELTALATAARAATPGEWKTPSERPFLVHTDDLTVAECFAVDRNGAVANAAHIAAANPAAVLRLIARLRDAEAAAALLAMAAEGEGT